MTAVELAAMGDPPVFRIGDVALDDSVFGGLGQTIELDLVIADVIPLDRQIAAGRFPPSGAVPLQPGVSAIARRDDSVLVSVQGGHAAMGFRRPGCFATRFLAPAALCVPLPNGLSVEVAAAGTETAITALLILTDHAQLLAGETVLVLGANGGVGRACVQLAVSLGGEVIAAARAPEALDVPAGVRTVSYDAITGLNADVIVDPVGGALFQSAILAGGHRCRHVFLGYNAGAVVELRLPLLMIAEHRILGFNEHAVAQDRFVAATRTALELLAAGTLSPVVESTFALSDIAAAYAAASSSGRTLLVP